MIILNKLLSTFVLILLILCYSTNSKFLNDNNNNDYHIEEPYPWFVMIINNLNMNEWSFGSLISEKAVLTSAKAVDSYSKLDLRVKINCNGMKSNKMISGSHCIESQISKVIYQQDFNFLKRSEDYTVILILQITLDRKYIITLSKVDDVNNKNCFLINWDIVNHHKTDLYEAATQQKVSLLYKLTDIEDLIRKRVLINHNEHAISKNVLMEFKYDENYTTIVDAPLESVGNPLVCSSLNNPSELVQIGVAAGYLEAFKEDNRGYKFIVGRYFVKINDQINEITETLKNLNSSQTWSIFDIFSH